MNVYMNKAGEMRMRKLRDKGRMSGLSLIVIAFLISGFLGVDIFAPRQTTGSYLAVDMRFVLEKGEKGSASEGLDLGQAFIDAFESNDEGKMKSLVRKNKNFIPDELINMIHYATSDQVDPEEMTWIVKISDKMASIYSAEFSDKKLEKLVANYKKWTRKEQAKKIKADMIFYSYKKDLKNKDYDAVMEKWTRSLKIYREIGDKLCEARRLDEIGLTFGKLGSFKTSIKLLNDARQIHNEIGNRWGEVNSFRYIAAGYLALEDYYNAMDAYKSALNIVYDIGDKAQSDILLSDIASVEEKVMRGHVKAEVE